jgi:hypothetical protein
LRDLPGGAHLVVELRQPRLVDGAFGQELERDRLIERQIVGAIHLARAAAAEDADQAVAAVDDRPGREAGGRRRRRRPPGSGRHRRVGVTGAGHAGVGIGVW